jgi:nickel superoxide dismutase
MKRILFRHIVFAFTAIISSERLSAHCQMPCGIYHDELVFEDGDQYVETMYKGITVMNESKFATPKDRCDFIRWVNTKENMSNELAEKILTYFLQQKIKPGESDTEKKLEAAHKMLFLLVQIKQTCDLAVLKQFAEAWAGFKLLFHREGYQCEMEKMKLKKWNELVERMQHEHDHEHGIEHTHNHDSDHDHNTKPVEQNKSV